MRFFLNIFVRAWLVLVLALMLPFFCWFIFGSSETKSPEPEQSQTNVLEKKKENESFVFYKNGMTDKENDFDKIHAQSGDIAIVSKRNKVHLYSFRKKHIIRFLEEFHNPHRPIFLAISSNQEFAICATNTGMIKIWSIKNRILHSSYQLCENKISYRSFCLSPDGSFLVGCLYSLCKGIIIASLSDGKVVKETRKVFQHIKEGIVIDLDISKDSLFFAVGQSDGSVMVFSKEGELQKSFKGYLSYLDSLNFTPENNLIVCQDVWNRSNLYIFSLKSEDLINKFKVPQGIRDCAVSPTDKAFIISTSKSINMYEYKNNTIRCKDSLEISHESLFWSNDGKYFGGLYHHGVGLWDYSRSRFVTKVPPPPSKKTTENASSKDILFYIFYLISYFFYLLCALVVISIIFSLYRRGYLFA